MKRFKGCWTSGKRRFVTLKDVARVISLREQSDPTLTLYYYACPHCSGFHLTRIPKPGCRAVIAKALQEQVS